MQHMYAKIVQDNIEQEKKDLFSRYSNDDIKLLNRMCSEINDKFSLNIQYLAEIDAYNLSFADEIILKYITNFSSETIKGYLIPNIALGKSKGCEEVILKMYFGFKESDEYIAKPGHAAPAHIYARYDNSFKNLKPKKIKDELVSLVKNPRDAFYLPFTTKMLASWKIPEVKDILVAYLESSSISFQSVGLTKELSESLPTLDSIRRELKLLSINALKYFPGIDTCNAIEATIHDHDEDVVHAAKKTLKVLRKLK